MSKQIGLVMRSTGSWYDVRTAEGQVVACRLKGVFKLKGFKVTNPIAVGDKVGYEFEQTDESQAVITEILPRENYIIRKSVHKTAHGHLLATNIDQAFLIVTLTQPRTSLGFIDRFLVSAESFRIPTCLLFNKLDVLSEEEIALQNDLKAIYEPLGYTCFFLSAETGEGLEPVREQLANQVTLVAGHSGVGKSTFLNALSPDLDLRTSEISTFANKGVHTTTFAEMFELGPDTFVIDTPGIKELGLMDIEDAELSHFFPEMRERLGQCKFHNCQHTNEPKCAVKEAVYAGEIAESRYINYLSMLENDDNRR